MMGFLSARLRLFSGMSACSKSCDGIHRLKVVTAAAAWASLRVVVVITVHFRRGIGIVCFIKWHPPRLLLQGVRVDLLNDQTKILSLTVLYFFSNRLGLIHLDDPCTLILLSIMYIKF